MDELAGRVAVVTGAASGIGRALADAWAAEGMSVVLADVERPRLDAAVAEVEESGVDALGVLCDVSDRAAVDALRDATLDRFGRVDVVCNNAGVGGGGELQTIDVATWEWVLGVNLFGVIHGVSAFLPTLLASGEGHIVNTASIAGLVSFPMMGPYNVSKHGVVTLSETLHQELLGHDGVGVSVLCPGFVNTGILESDRNRPDRGPRERSAEEAAVRRTVEAAYAVAMRPADVAALVVDAVRTGRFYVYTDDEFLPLVAQRGREVAAADDPGPIGHLFDHLPRGG